MSKRLTRKDIKHDIRDDEVQSVLMRIFEYLAENPKQLAGGLAGVAVVVLGATAAVAYFDHRADTAHEELAAAVKVVQAPIDAEAPKPEDPDSPSFASDADRDASARQALDELSGGVGTRAAGEMADLLLASMAAREGDTDTAREIWKSFLEDHQEHVLALSVRLNLIHLDRNTGRAQEVADELQRELDGTAQVLPLDVLLFELAQTRELLEEKEAALELYQRILDEHAQSPYSARARQMTTAAS